MKKMILTAATLAILCSCGGQKTEAGDAQDSLVEVTPENPDELLDTAKVELWLKHILMESNCWAQMTLNQKDFLNLVIPKDKHHHHHCSKQEGRRG